MNKTVVVELASKARSGDLSALVALCKAIVNDVFFRADCIMGNHMDADDVVQEVLIRVCKKIKGLEDPKAFNAWLGTIILNETRRQLTKNSSHPMFDIEDHIDDKVEEDEDFLPLEYIEKAEAANTMMNIISALPRRQREAVMLHYYDELGISETAVAMGVTQQAASLYLKLARERIKGIIEDRADANQGAGLMVAAMPLDALITQSLQHGAETFVPAGKGAVQSALDGCMPYIKSMALKDAAGASAGISSGLKIGIVAAVAAAAVGFWVFASPGPQPGDDASPAPVASADAHAVGDLQFSGGDPSYAYLNPLHAVPVTNSDYGELAVQGWKITTTDGQNTLFSGDGEDADSALAAMQQRGEDGEYILTYTLKDAKGKSYELTSNFFVGAAAGAKGTEGSDGTTGIS